MPLSVALFFVGFIVGALLTAGLGYALYVIRARVKRAREQESADENTPSTDSELPATQTMT